MSQCNINLYIKSVYFNLKLFKKSVDFCCADSIIGTINIKEKQMTTLTNKEYEAGMSKMFAKTYARFCEEFIAANDIAIEDFRNAMNTNPKFNKAFGQLFLEFVKTGLNEIKEG